MAADDDAGVDFSDLVVDGDDDSDRAPVPQPPAVPPSPSDALLVSPMASMQLNVTLPVSPPLVPGPVGASAAK